ncbi:Ubiquitin domain-containing protein 7SL RNA1, partial [Bienertia sinuspersici]
MDVIFVTPNRESFTIEIGYFDTVLEIKEKIQKYKNIPISQQTLIFHGKILEDNGDVASCVILHNSKIYLNISSPNDKQKSPEKLRLKTDDFHPFSPIITSRKTQIVLNLPASKTHVYNKLCIDVDLNDSVEQLKKKLYKIEALYINKNIELQDHRRLREYELKDGSEIDVLMRLPSVPTPNSMSNTNSMINSKKLKIFVVSKCGTKKLPVEVNPQDKVQVLRKELEKLEQKGKFELPEEGYFFIYQQNVMEEKETFKWHGVRQDDTIDIFNGNVTGG